MAEIHDSVLNVGTTSQVPFISRFYGAFWGMFVGDALSAPTHGYTNRQRLHDDYGWINGMTRPKNPHPESTLFRTQFQVVPGKNDILHGRDKEWRTPGTHFHQHLEPGDNTLIMQLAAHLGQCLLDCDGFDAAQYQGRYLDFMLNPDSHNDTLIPAGHLAFFENYGKGREISKCARESFCIDGLASGLPIILYYHQDVRKAQMKLREFLALTHKGEPLARTADLICELICLLLKGHDLEEALFDIIKEERGHPALNFPYRRWRDLHDDEGVIGNHIKIASHIDDAIPVIIYLAIKYRDDVGQALAVNANLGGATCQRGAIIGAIMGAIHGCEELPGEWVSEITEYGRLDALCDNMIAQIS